MEKQQGTPEIDLNPERLKGMSPGQLNRVASALLERRFTAESTRRSLGLTRGGTLARPGTEGDVSDMENTFVRAEGPEMFAIGLQTREEALIASGGRIEDIL